PPRRPQAVVPIGRRDVGHLDASDVIHGVVPDLENAPADPRLRQSGRLEDLPGGESPVYTLVDGVVGGGAARVKPRVGEGIGELAWPAEPRKARDAGVVRRQGDLEMADGEVGA